ncbi:hypothetical protein VD0002_g9721 [Verticillium dahliae]|uniref:Methyltransferase type 11 domain-containing protein n=1 Tax=Verticillium dahliae TaxID=27337 RepID=A0A2J8DVM5_VERDA|nr:Autophagy-related protein 29 [Verticillium dahliae VDG2]PNH34105.1 hypothetical protein BJF96_g2693 [Verticillium dahliae]PNH44980.1 hypothetical protein VD0004_g2835 [Verticillium dahliae]PNH53318.1 hypothetical protein VD0003_g4103 [Verticillium dahliae]PNH57218.1 hypothetical protein VD0002_g9721 [Verticillium dahliae]
MTSLGTIFWGLIDPWLFMSCSLYYLPPTILALLRARDVSTLFSWPRLQAAWFGRFWAWAGPGVREGGQVRVGSLLEGRVRGGQIVDGDSDEDRAAAAALRVRGVVIEVGAGSGMWVNMFAKVGGVQRVFGVEPNAASQPALERRVKEAGLDGVYEVVPVGIEELGDASRWDGKIEPESVDCIVSILCLCSIPDQEANIATLYGYLKKGGRWYVYEHVQAKRNLFMKLYQRFVNLFWPHVIGGCELCRDTETALKNAGEWQSFELAQPPEEPWYHTLPHILGVLTK